MKALQVTYEKLFNLGNFSHEKISITLEVEPGDKASEVLKKAKEFVESKNKEKNSVSQGGYLFTYEIAKNIVSNPNGNYFEKVEAAKQALEIFEKIENEKDDLPF